MKSYIEWLTESADTLTVNGKTRAYVKPPYNNENSLVMVKTKPFDEKFKHDEGFYIGKDGINGIKNRYSDFGKWFTAEHDTPMQTSDVTVRNNGSVIFGNGRHRYAWLRDSGLEHIPVTMDSDSLANAKRHGLVESAEFYTGKSLSGDNGESIHTDGGHIDIQHSNTIYSPRKHSVIDFYVHPDKRGNKIGDKLLKHAKQKYNDLGGQVSSVASLKVFYNNGFRNPEIPNGTFNNHLDKFNDNWGSLFMAQNDHNGKSYT